MELPVTLAKPVKQKAPTHAVVPSSLSWVLSKSPTKKMEIPMNPLTTRANSKVTRNSFLSIIDLRNVF
jgi:hypothetical protein